MRLQVPDFFGERLVLFIELGAQPGLCLVGSGKFRFQSFLMLLGGGGLLLNAFAAFGFGREGMGQFSRPGFRRCPGGFEFLGAQLQLMRAGVQQRLLLGQLMAQLRLRLIDGGELLFKG